MKKLIAIVVCAVLLVCAWCVSANGVEKPAGVQELYYLTALPDAEAGIVNISQGLTTPDVYSHTHFTSESLTAYEQYEASRYLSYGLTMIGASGMGRRLSAAIDGVWAHGNIAVPGNPMLDNGNFANGAFAYYPTEKTYNVKGESGKDDSRYVVMFTFNFGKVAEINSFGYASPANNIPQAADFYISNDGENWELVGYYDLTAKRMAGNDTWASYCPSIKTGLLGEDITGTVENGFQLSLWDLGGVEAQFLRIAHTSNGGAALDSYYDPTTGTFSTDYSAWTKGYGLETNFREMLVYGKMTDKTNNITATEGEPPETQSPDVPGEGEETTTATNKPSLPPAKATTAAATTAAPVDPAQTTASETEEKKGCGSSIMSAFAVLAVATVGVTTVSARKRRK